MSLPDQWIAQRTRQFDSSGIRRMFDLAAQLKDPINLSIGQPDFDVPDPVKESMIQAVRDGRNGYAMTQGIPELRERLQAQVNEQFQDPDREVFVCSGTSGGLFLAALSVIDPGDEVIFFDPYFVMYPALIQLAGGVPVPVDTYPDFQPDPERLEAAITPRTKMIIFNSPSNPTGVCASHETMRAVAELAERHGICLVSDEIYSRFTYDRPHETPARWNPSTLVIDGFSKTYAMTGWRVAYVHGPSELIRTMIKLQQFTFVCAPHPAQVAAVTALDTDMQAYVDRYRAKRDFMLRELAEDYEIVAPGGAFYLFPKLPWGTGQAFMEAAIDANMMVIPGNIFSNRDSHFRISYAVSDEMLERGVETLKKLARQPRPSSC